MGSRRALASPRRKLKEAARRPPLGDAISRSAQLIIIPFGGYRGDRPEAAVLLIVRTGCEIERVGAGCTAADQGQLPQSIDNEGLAIGAVEFVDEAPVRVELVDLAFAEIADKDVAAEPAEGKGGARHAPGRIERPAAGEAPQQMAVGIEDVDKAVARTLNVVMLVRALLRVGDE